MHQDGSGNDLSEIGYGGICITKGHREIHISSWFGLWMHGGVLAVSNIPSKWVCSPLWEAKSIKQLLWHLENPFTMIETIQLKPLQSVFSFSRASTSHIWYTEKSSNLHINTKKWHPYYYANRVLNPWYRYAWDCKSDSKILSTCNSGCIATARLIQLGTDSIITFFSVLANITSCTKTSLYYW